MIKKVVWGAICVVVFAVAFAGGVLINTLTTPSLAGIEKVDWDKSMGTIATDLPYGDGELNKFDLYLPADRQRASELVLYIHAGGFTGGDKSDDADMAKYFASQGYVAATINYSLSSNANSVSVYDMTLEIDRGVDAIVAAAAARGYDLNGLVVAGGSAGGNLAMTYAYRDGADGPVPVRAVISLVGPASFEPAAWFGLDQDYTSQEAAEAAAGFVSIMTGDAITPAMMRTGEYEKYLEPISPLMLVTPRSPPTLAAYGELDKVAPYPASRDLEPTLAADGVPHDVLVFPNSGHGLNRDPDFNARLGQSIQYYLTTYAPLG